MLLFSAVPVLFSLTVWALPTYAANLWRDSVSGFVVSTAESASKQFNQGPSMRSKDALFVVSSLPIGLYGKSRADRYEGGISGVADRRYRRASWLESQDSTVPLADRGYATGRRMLGVKPPKCRETGKHLPIRLALSDTTGSMSDEDLTGVDADVGDYAALIQDDVLGAEKRPTVHGATVTKPELSNALAAASGVSKVAVFKVLDVLRDTIADYVVRGRKVNLTKVGAFGAKIRPARVARNPRTSEPVQVRRKLAPTFSFSKTMKDLVKDKKLMMQSQSRQGVGGSVAG